MKPKKAKRTDNVILHDHPLIRHKISMMRALDCVSHNFRDLTREIGAFLCFQAAETLGTSMMEIANFKGQTDSYPVLEVPQAVIVPILRAGLVVGEGALQAMPTAHVGHVMFRRVEGTHDVALHLVVLPDPTGRDFILCDFSVGTGNTAAAAIEELKAHKVDLGKIKLLTILISPEAAERFRSDYPDVAIHAAAMEEGLDEQMHIYPGFGDPDVRLFGIK